MVCSKVKCPNQPSLIRERRIRSHGNVGKRDLPCAKRDLDDVSRRTRAHTVRCIDQAGVDIDASNAPMKTTPAPMRMARLNPDAPMPTVS